METLKHHKRVSGTIRFLLAGDVVFSAHILVAQRGEQNFVRISNRSVYEGKEGMICDDDVSWSP
jgi:hypothetical protein